ncbi:MAG: ATP-binding protein [Colwellia sp.]|nr:ATP-binding protein [Colwellia sp.]
MTLKHKFYLTTFLLHSILLVGAFYTLNISTFNQADATSNKWAFVAIEIIILLSLGLFISLIKKALAPSEYLDLFSNIINEQEFATRFSHTGNKEIDNLMTLFNQMLSQLYDERLKLGDRQGMLQQLMNAIPVSIIVFDYNNKISQLNPAAEALFSIKSTELITALLGDIQHPLIPLLSKVELGQSMLLSDDKGKRYRCHHNFFRDRGFDRHFYIIQELTAELKSSEKKTYNKLIRLMSHEVNNTIAATSSVLQSCLYYADQIDEAERHDYENAMRLVIKRTDNLNQFMQEYAQVVRLPKPSIESCNLYHLLLSTQQLFQEKLTQQRIEFHLPNDAIEQSIVFADQRQIEQVLLNIIKNAIESIGELGEITIEFITNHQQLVLRVMDTGEGINEHCQQDLFTPFFSTKAEGQGIGLMLVSEILEAHNFSFSLKNRPIQGACFEIQFNAVL